MNVFEVCKSTLDYGSIIIVNGQDGVQVQESHTSDPCDPIHGSCRTLFGFPELVTHLVNLLELIPCYLYQEGNHTPSTMPILYKQVTLQSGNKISIVRLGQSQRINWGQVAGNRERSSCQMDEIKTVCVLFEA